MSRYRYIDGFDIDIRGRFNNFSTWRRHDEVTACRYTTISVDRI